MIYGQRGEVAMWIIDRASEPLGEEFKSKALDDSGTVALDGIR